MRTPKRKNDPPDVVIDQVACKDYAIYCGDCIEVLKDIPNNSIGCVIYSPPFAQLYSYSDHDQDMANTKNYEQFFEHYDFLVQELYRIMMPGRIVAVHCMDLPTHITKEGYIGLEDFPGHLVKAHQKYGFIYHSRHCIWKDPLTAATRSHALGLAHKQIVKDSSMCRTGIPDYVVAFRKPGLNPKPIPHPEGLTEYPGETPIPRNFDKYIGWSDDPKFNKRSHWIWQKIASPVWFDIDQTKVLPFRKAKDKDDQRHICCLQLQVIERCLILWSTEGDICCSPFAGVGSEVYQAVKMGRRGLGIELKPSYFRQMKRNLESLKHKIDNLPGFDV